MLPGAAEDAGSPKFVEPPDEEGVHSFIASVFGLCLLHLHIGPGASEVEGSPEYVEPPDKEGAHSFIAEFFELCLLHLHARPGAAEDEDSFEYVEPPDEDGVQLVACPCSLQHACRLQVQLYWTSSGVTLPPHGQLQWAC